MSTLTRSFDILTDKMQDSHTEAKHLLKAMVEYANINTKKELEHYFTMRVLEGHVSPGGARATMQLILNYGFVKND